MISLYDTDLLKTWKEFLKITTCKKDDPAKK